MDPQVIEAAWRHAFERIQAAPVETAPFAHFAVDGVFPEDFYAEMIARLPDDDGYAFGDERGAEGPERHRGAIDFFQTDVAERVADARGAFWKDLTNAEVTRDLATLVLGKFGPHFDAAEIHQRFGAQPQVRGKWLLTRDRAGYLLTPHNDTPMKLVAGLFYLPGPGLENDEGTTLLSGKPDREVTLDEGLRGARADFDVARKLPFAANSMMAFARAENSYHCVDELGAQVTQRDILMFNVVGATGRYAPSEDEERAANP